MGKNIKAIFFDLDGTLLPMDQEVFAKAYFGALVKNLATRGYAPDALIKTVWAGTEAMIKNDGSVTNEEAFWQTFCSSFGEGAIKEREALEDFYKTDFEAVKKSVGFLPSAKHTVDKLSSLGIRLILATNPIFPAVATHARIRWAGLEREKFEYVTTYENSHFAKPNLAYYREILSATGLSADECLMVGNDAHEDMVAEELGMRVFLLTECLINKTGKDLAKYPSGNLDDLMHFITQK